MEKYKGETDKEFEARKKRVKRVRQGVDYGLAHAGSGGIGTAAPLPPVPKVTSSTIMTSGADEIVVLWDRPMKGTGNIKDAINIIIDGAAAIHPTAVTFSGKAMTLKLPAAATAGQVITWAYDDQNPTETLDSVADNKEADNQTYAVVNMLSTTTTYTADSTTVSVDIDTITVDKG